MPCATVEDAWQRVVSWCERNAPVTFGQLRLPASESALASAEASFPRRWPDDLRRWYALQDGAEWQSNNSPLPSWRILSLREMTEYGPSFVPIGDTVWASYLYVDTRPGSQFGCVADHDGL